MGFKCQAGPCAGVEWYELLRRCHLVGPRHRPERVAAECIECQMDSPRRIFVDDAMWTPIVERPSLAGSHMDTVAAAKELDVGMSDDGNMDPRSVAPVVIDIHMHGHAVARFQAHQPGAAVQGTKQRENL